MRRRRIFKCEHSSVPNNHSVAIALYMKRLIAKQKNHINCVLLSIKSNKLSSLMEMERSSPMPLLFTSTSFAVEYLTFIWMWKFIPTEEKYIIFNAIETFVVRGGTNENNCDSKYLIANAINCRPQFSKFSYTWATNS